MRREAPYGWRGALTTRCRDVNVRFIGDLDMHSCLRGAAVPKAGPRDRSWRVGLKLTNSVLNIPFFANNSNTSTYMWNESLTAVYLPFERPRRISRKLYWWGLNLFGISQSEENDLLSQVYVCNRLRGDHVFKFHPRHENPGISDRRMPQIKTGLSAKCRFDGLMTLAFRIRSRWLVLDRASDCHTHIALGAS